MEKVKWMTDRSAYKSIIRFTSYIYHFPYYINHITSTILHYSIYMWYDKLLENDKLPDAALRIGIRKLCKQRLDDETLGNEELQQEKFMDLVAELKQSPIAVNTADANEQHYELPTEFFSVLFG